MATHAEEMIKPMSSMPKGSSTGLAAIALVEPTRGGKGKGGRAVGRKTNLEENDISEVHLNDPPSTLPHQKHQQRHDAVGADARDKSHCGYQRLIETMDSAVPTTCNAGWTGVRVKRMWVARTPPRPARTLMYTDPRARRGNTFSRACAVISFLELRMILAVRASHPQTQLRAPFIRIRFSMSRQPSSTDADVR